MLLAGPSEACHPHCPHDVPSGVSPPGLLGSARAVLWAAWAGGGVARAWVGGWGVTVSSCPGGPSCARFGDVPA